MRRCTRWASIGGFAALLLTTTTPGCSPPSAVGPDEKPKATIFKTDYPDLFVSFEVPPEDEWTLSGVGDKDQVLLPQLVRKSTPPAVGRISIHRVEVPKDAKERTLKAKLENIVNGRVADWQSRLKQSDAKPDEAPREDHYTAVAASALSTPTKLDGAEHPAFTVSVWLIQRRTDNTYRHFRVSETVTGVEREPDAVLIVQFGVEQQMAKDSPIVLDMSDSMIEDPATKVRTLHPLVRLHPALETARSSFRLHTKR